jgi:hypothetical protein
MEGVTIMFKLIERMDIIEDAIGEAERHFGYSH